MKSGERQPAEDESDLVRRLGVGDAAGFDALFEKHRRGLFAYVRGLVGDYGVAEEIVQDCFLELVRNGRRIRPEQGAGGWLYRVARNRAIDVLRAQALGPDAATRESQDGTEGECLAAPGPSPDQDAIGRESAADVRRALEMLPQKERDLLLLRYFGDLKFNEIARMRKRPLGTSSPLVM